MYKRQVINGFIKTTVGKMTFDSADVESMIANGRWEDTIMHEMGHVLGIGTFWSHNKAHSGDITDDKYTGVNALKQWRALGCSGDLPVETDGGLGTAGGHWDEDCLADEMLTGVARSFLPKNSQKLSQLTVASLEDIGFKVDYTAADRYTIDDLAICNQGGKNYCPEHADRDQHTGLPPVRKLRATPRQSRKLSAEGIKMAEMRAAVDLKARRAEHEKIDDKDDDEIFLGGEIIAVLIEEDGELKGTIVTWDQVKDLAQRL